MAGETELVAPWKASSTLKHSCNLRALVVPSVTVYGGGENRKHLQGRVSNSAEIDNLSYILKYSGLGGEKDKGGRKFAQTPEVSPYRNSISLLQNESR